jgi:hypothetical protein
MTFSMNEKDEYTRFWEPLSKHVKQNLNLHPVLLYVGKEDISISEEYGDVHRIYCGDDIPTYIPSTWGWFWVSSQYPEKVCMQSGIDMAVINKDYFDNKIENLDDDCYVVSRADSYTKPHDMEYWKREFNTFVSYYHIAKGKIFKEALDLMDDFVDEVQKINSIDYSNSPRDDSVLGTGYSDNPNSFLSEACIHNGGKWCLDEIHSTHMLRKYKKNGGKVIEHSMSDCRILDIFPPQTPKKMTSNWVDCVHFNKPYYNEDQINILLS